MAHDRDILSLIMVEPGIRLTAYDDPPGEVEIAEVRKNARARFRLCKKRFWYSGATLLLSCSSVHAFLYEHVFHPYWESFGKYLALPSMGLLLPLVYCAP